jgi:endonuclease/exonuclease/phosphatase family metal-dependent hydrolase
MSYNIRFNNPNDKGTSAWLYRRQGLVDIVKKFGPDLLGCQEVLQDQLDFIQEELGENYSHAGKPREYNRQTGEYYGEYSCVFFNNQRFELLDQNTFWLSETPDVPGSHGWDAACNRVCTWVKLRIRDTNRIVFHFNTHWDHVGMTSRLKSSELMKSRMMEQLIKCKIEKIEPLMLVSGDFNCKPNSEELLRMYTPVHNTQYDLDISLRYARSEAQVRRGPEATFTGFDFKSSETIDFIFYQDGFKGARKYRVPLYDVIDTTLPGGYAPSDHRPVATLIGSGEVLSYDDDDSEFVVIENH